MPKQVKSKRVAPKGKDALIAKAAKDPQAQTLKKKEPVVVPKRTKAEWTKIKAVKKAYDDRVKALKAKQAAKTSGIKKKRSIRTNVHFHRPKTLTLARKPKYPRHSVESRPVLNQYSILKYPLGTESAMKNIEDNRTLVFIVDLKANKRQIKDCVKKMYDVKADSVNTLIR